jgi:glycosyltransferase involved in cell wall biosynthesis
VRLLIVSQYFWPENFRINDLVAELIQRGHDVTILTGHPNYPSGLIFPEFRANRAHFKEFNGADVVRVPLLPRDQGGFRLILNYLSFAVSASLLGSWKLRHHKFDAIFAYEPSPITVGIPAVVLRATKKAPLTFWVLDLWPETLEAIGVVRSRRLLKAIGKLVSFIYNRCDLILAQSKSFIPQIAKYCSDRERIEYFPSWAETVFDMARVDPASEVPEKQDSFDVMFAGNIGDAQDFPAILEAATLLEPHAHIRWIIVGDGRMAEWVKEEIARRKLQDCVLMVGRHPVERMPSFYKHADALLMSLKDEPIFSMTIPGKLQSYLAAGIPVVAMLNGEGADVVSRSHSGVTCPAGDAPGLAEAVLHLSRLTTEQRAEMGRNAVVASTTEFDRDRLISQLETWLKHLGAGDRTSVVEASQ